MRLHISLFLLLVTTILSAQSKVRVYGYVIDSNNRGVEMANVYFENSTIGTSTNKNGYYDLTIEVADSASIVYSMLGYKTVKHTIYNKQRVLQISVELISVSNEIEDIEVVAQRRQISTMDFVDPAKFRLMPNTAGGIESLLITFAGVSQSNELSSQYNVRGGNFDENLVYVNGIEIYRPMLIRSGQQEGLSFVNPDLVHNLGFSSGGFSAEYGDKMSSVLDITYKKPKSFEASASVSLLGSSAYVGTSNGKFTQIHGFRHKTSRNLLRTLDTKGDYQPTFVDYQTYLTYQLQPKTELTFLGNFSQNNFLFVPTIRETNFGTYNTGRKLTVYFEGQEVDVFRTSFGAMTLNHKPQKDLNLGFTVSAFHSNENETYDILGEYILSEVKMDLDEENKEGAVLGIGKYQEHARNRLRSTVANVSHAGDFKTSRHHLKWGVQLQSEKISDKMSEWEWRDSAGYSLPWSDSQVNLVYNLKSVNSISSLRNMAYVLDTYRWKTEKGSYSLTGGLRSNYWTYNNEWVVSPRVSLSIIPFWDGDFSFRVAGGMYYQTPFYKEMRQQITDADGNVQVQLNSAIKAQRSAQAVVGGDYYFRGWGRPFKLTSEAYLKMADRIVTYNVDNVRIRYSGVNDANAYTYGVDFKLFGELVPGTDSWINFSLMQSKDDIIGDSYVLNTYDENRKIVSSETIYPGYVSSPNEQRYSFSMVFQDYFPTNPDYKMQLRFFWADGLPYGPPKNNAFRSVWRTKPYRRADIGLSRVLVNGKDRVMDYQWLKHVKSLWINFELLNAFDFRNENSQFWVTDIYGQEYAAPNYLTSRQYNLKLIVDFK